MPPVVREEPARDQASGVSVAVLRELQSLQGTGDQILDALVPRARLLQLEAGQQLLRRGEANLRGYILISSRLRVGLGESPVQVIWKGRTVGELGALARRVPTC